MMNRPQVFFAYTADGKQFDSIEALDAASARDDIATIYTHRPFYLRDADVDIDGFYVLAIPVPIETHRRVRYWSSRFSECADLGALNGQWVTQRLKTAVADMVQAINQVAPLPMESD